MKLTKAQRKALEIAVHNGGVIMQGGLDKDPIRKDVIFKLFDVGLLTHLPPYHDGSGQPWEITKVGWEAIQKYRKS